MSAAKTSGEITLAVATYNQCAFLESFLEAFVRFSAGRTKLLIVDDGSTDATRSVAARFAGMEAIAFDTIPHHGTSRARNRALELCATRWLAFTDTDCLLEGKYYDALVNIPKRYAGFPAVEGAVTAPRRPWPPLTHAVENSHGGFYATANMAFLVEALRAIGGFDESFRVYREDTDCALRILERFGTIPFWPRWTVHHPCVPTLFGPALRNAPRKMRLIVSAEELLYRKHPRSYALVRHAPDYAATLRRWRCLYALSAIRGTLQYFQHRGWGRRPAGSPGVFVALQACVLALVEQACIILASLQPGRGRVEA